MALVLLSSIFGHKFRSTVKAFVMELAFEHPVLTAFIVGSLSSVTLYVFIHRKNSLRRKLRAVTKRKQEERQAQFEDLKSKFKLNQDARTILNLDFKTLVSRLQSRELTAVQVLEAFIAKSLEANDFCNAITEFNPKAMQLAEDLDKLPQIKGPLHGVPFAVKDDNNLEGMDSTLGFSKNCYKPHTESAAIVLALQDLGGVPFAKTNVPQTLLSFGSDNPVFGTTTSSHNQKLSPGGSSSGTGSLVGSSGCLFGTGSDIGGSLRIPATFNGVSSLKPTFGRMSVRGISACFPNILGLDATSGIIGQNATIVSTVYKHLLENNLQSKFDPRVLPIPWNATVFNSKEKLRIGYFTQVPFFPPVGDTIETVERAVEALRKQGHTLIPIELPCDEKIMRTAANFILADGNKQLLKLLKGEEVAKCAELNNLGSKFPHWVMRILAFLLQRKSLLPWVYSKSLSTMLDAGAFTGHQLWENKAEQKQIVEEMYAVWKKHEIVGVICPVMPIPAIPVNLPGLLPVAAVYTMVWNVTDFPAGVVKFGSESGKNIDAYNTNGDNALNLAKEACKESIGSPICVQVVGLPYQEELVLRIMQELDDYRLSQSQDNS